MIRNRIRTSYKFYQKRTSTFRLIRVVLRLSFIAMRFMSSSERERRINAVGRITRKNLNEVGTKLITETKRERIGSKLWEGAMKVKVSVKKKCTFSELKKCSKNYEDCF